MIIFDLDGTLADCEHRRHFVDPEKNKNFCRYDGEDFRGYKGGIIQLDICWKPDWKSFHEACDRDIPIIPLVNIFHDLHAQEREIHIWSARSESVREKTENWLFENIKLKYCCAFDTSLHLKMRPINNSESDEILKERWLDELYDKGVQVDYVFDDRPKVIRMWRRRGIFVFNCGETMDWFH
jgi:hypothetical protein